MTDNVKQSQQPVFILSCVRSGSTMLRCIIDTHPNLCSPGHLNLGPLCTHLYAAAYYSLGRLPAVATEEQRDRLALAETRRIVADLLDRYAQGKGKGRWCEKSTVNIDHLELLARVFPEADYVCLYRNCLDVADSCIKISPLGYMAELAPYVQKNPANLVAAMLDNWLDKTGKLLAFEQSHRDRCFRVNYETLVTQPKQTLAPLFEFLGESWRDDLIDAVFSAPHDQGDGDLKVWFSAKINTDSVGKGSAIPLTSIPEAAIADIDALHRQLGYQTIAALYAGEDKGDACNDRQVDLNDFFRNRLLEKAAAASGRFNLRGVCKFVITGLKGGVWIVESSGCGLTLKEKHEYSDCTIATTYKIFCELIEGRKNPVHAYQAGEITGGGNMNLALEFGSLLFGG